ncbi:MAG TPA: hypothetical protein VIF62_38150 [Labilithrix sp.]|jgi:TPR repeat protein
MKLRALALVALASLVSLVPQTSRADETTTVDRFIVQTTKTCKSVMPESGFACIVADLARRCAADDATACMTAARVNLSNNVHGVAFGTAAKPLLARACTLEPQACIEAAHVAIAGWADPDLAKRFLTFGCLRSGAVCRAASGMYAEGKWVPRDVEASHKFAAMATKG